MNLSSLIYFRIIRDNVIAIVLSVLLLMVFVDQISVASEEIELELVGYRTKSTMLGDKLIFEFARPTGGTILVNSALAATPPDIGQRARITVSRSLMLNRPYYTISPN